MSQHVLTWKSAGMDSTDEMQSEASSFETRFANQPIKFADYSEQEIDKRLRAGNVGALYASRSTAKRSCTCAHRRLQTSLSWMKAHFCHTVLPWRRSCAGWIRWVFVTQRGDHARKRSLAAFLRNVLYLAPELAHVAEDFGKEIRNALIARAVHYD